MPSSNLLELQVQTNRNIKLIKLKKNTYTWERTYNGYLFDTGSPYSVLFPVPFIFHQFHFSLSLNKITLYLCTMNLLSPLISWWKSRLAGCGSVSGNIEEVRVKILRARGWRRILLKNISCIWHVHCTLELRSMFTWIRPAQGWTFYSFILY